MNTKEPANEVPAAETRPEEKTPKTWGRRELIKALAATGGAVTLSNLPNRWEKPLVEVGVLPAHAQATGDDNTGGGGGAAPTYAILCDSEPGGGNYDTHPTHPDEIHDIRPQLVLTSGAGSVENITATMTVSFDSGSADFSPSPPRTAVTDASGVADFGNITVSNDDSTTQFYLVFSFDVPGGTPETIQCGRFDHS